MKILVLGGTVFLGRHLVEEALTRGHEVTLFNRGQHNPDLFASAEKLRGDRNGNLQALHGGKWDAVIDTSGYVPRVVEQSAKLLAEAVGQYVFVSSISVYPDIAAPNLDETAEVAKLRDGSPDAVTGESYGPLKALCEQVAENYLPGRAVSVRAGLIVGPHDPTDRFTYWVHRVARGGETLAPGNPRQLTQFIDVRDLSAWMIDCVERKTMGVFNATGPEHPLTMESFLNICNEVLGRRARFEWVDEGFLQSSGIAAWSELPLWIPGASFTVNCAKAIASGLKFRQLEETIRATHEWNSTRPPNYKWRAGLEAAKETSVLADWRAQNALMANL